jgi:hypothetical protein
MITTKSLRRAQITALAGILLATMGTANAYADTAPAQTEASIIRPLSFIKTDDLKFGKILPSGVAGTVVLAPAGTRTADNGIVLVGNDQQPARFAGQGRFNQAVTISLSSSTILINGPGASMLVRNFTIGSTPSVILGTTPLRFRIGNSQGIFAFPVGATLDVGANQTPGTYTGNWNITLNYQ